MTKRRLIFLIILIAIIILIVFGIIYFTKPTTNISGTTTGTNFISRFFPFGKSTQTTTEPTVSTDVSGFEPITVPTPEEWLTKVSSFPIAGYGVFMKERFVELPTIIPTAIENTETTNPTPPTTEFIPALKYVEKTTGNIYQTFADKIEEKKITTTIIPKVYDAYFGNNGSSVSMRHLKNDEKTIETFAGILPTEILGGDMVGIGEMKGSFLPEGITDISVSPDTSKLLYLFNYKENAIGIAMDPSTGKRVQVFSSPFTEWLSWWPNLRMITFTSKPSSNVLGYMYAVDPEKKDFNKILGGIRGLTTLTSPSGKLVLYANNNLSLSIFNTDTADSTSLSIKTLPEKCIWNKTSDAVYCAVPRSVSGSEYPDVWYQGEVSFSDDIWKTNIGTGNTLMVADLSVKGEEIDGIKLGLDENENYLFFVNKKDSYLWKFNLK